MTTHATYNWDTVSRSLYYKDIDSSDIGVFSVIRDMYIPGRTYITKRGQVKTSIDSWVPAHYTLNGTYIGRVSDFGESPVAYPLKLLITPRHFKNVGVGETVEDCFELLEGVIADSESRIKDFPTQFFKELRKSSIHKTSPPVHVMEPICPLPQQNSVPQPPSLLHPASVIVPAVVERPEPVAEEPTPAPQLPPAVTEPLAEPPVEEPTLAPFTTEKAANNPTTITKTITWLFSAVFIYILSLVPNTSNIENPPDLMELGGPPIYTLYDQPYVYPHIRQTGVWI